MLIREATKEDVPEIINVLKASLGEADLPLSSEIWNYKHVNNPFGKSLILLAEENGKIAGVRAFMRWKWKKKDEVYSAFRAVDTATHPEFQGKGIFKKLTLKAVEMGVQANHSFVFNTPNENSRPGYLKMGWEIVGKINVGIQPAWNSFYNLANQNSQYQIKALATTVQVDDLCEYWNKNLETENKTFTLKFTGYLKWRYENNPLQKYEVHYTPDYYIAGYVKKTKNIKELRISECICRAYQMGQVQHVIKKWCSKFGVQVITYSPGLFKSQILSLKGNFGPVLTLKNLNLVPADLDDKKDIINWCYSLGDLELF